MFLVFGCVYFLVNTEVFACLPSPFMYKITLFFFYLLNFTGLYLDNVLPASLER